MRTFKSDSPWHERIHFFQSVTSTNDLLLAWAEGGSPEGTSVIAKEQTSGRGQFHRPWSSLFGMGLWMSVLLRLPIEHEIIKPLSQLGVVSLYDALLKVKIPPASLKIKPPNDLLLDGKKVAGILVETRRGSSPFAVIGIGLNIHQTHEDFPLELRDKATSLVIAGMPPIDPKQLAPIVIDSLYLRYQELHSHPGALDEVWRKALFL